MSELKLSLKEILKELDRHEATETNKQVAAAIITGIFKGAEDEHKKAHNRSEN